MSDLLKQFGEAVTGRARIPVEVRTEDAGALPTDVRHRLLPDRPRGSEQCGQALWRHDSDGVACPRPESRGGLLLTIEDDGTGFDPAAAGSGQLGLGIMRERAEAIGATLTVNSAPGQGTTVAVTWSPGDTAQGPRG